MQFNAQQLDVLTELANIGASRAATRMSATLHEDIGLLLPQVMSLPGAKVVRLMQAINPGKSIVTLNVSGMIEGVAHFVFSQRLADGLVALLLGKERVQNRLGLEVYEREALLEVGNIFISTYVACLADMCGGVISLSSPRYIETRQNKELLSGMGCDAESVSMVVMNSELSARRQRLSGNLMMVLTTLSAQTLINNLLKKLPKNNQL